MFIQEPPPDTSGYMIAGYIVAFSVMAIYLLSLVIRWRNLSRDIEALESIRDEGDPPSGSKRKTARRKAAAKR